MKAFFSDYILGWMEVWAMFIPLIVLHYNKRQPVFIKPVIYYLWFALAIHLLSDVFMEYNRYVNSFRLPNTYLYNIHAVVMFGIFNVFFYKIMDGYFDVAKKFLPVVFVVFFVLYFFKEENFFNTSRISGNLLTVCAYLLLVYCMLYYLARLKADVDKLWSEKAFWIVTGLSIYVVVNFFVFLFYNPLIDTKMYDLANQMWNFHNIAYLIFLIFIAKAFYVPARN